MKYKTKKFRCKIYRNFFFKNRHSEAACGFGRFLTGIQKSPNSPATIYSQPTNKIGLLFFTHPLCNGSSWIFFDRNSKKDPKDTRYNIFIIFSNSVFLSPKPKY